MRALLLLTIVAAANAQVIKARAYMFAAVKDSEPSGKPIGVIDFIQDGGRVTMNGSVATLAAGRHGFHVHEKGDLGNGCLLAGPHFNPHKVNHGAPDAKVRHVGDLGNIHTPADAATTIDVSDALIRLSGEHSIIGRGLVIHEKPDDLGLSDTEASRTTGDAGSRIACGVIGLIEDAPGSPAATATASILLLSLIAYLI